MADPGVREVRPGATITLQALGFPAGQVPPFRLVALVGGAVVIGPTTVGVSEDSPGNYDIQLAIPADLAGGDYAAEWDFNGWVRDDDIVRVTGTVVGGPAPAPAYATPDDLADYVQGTLRAFEVPTGAEAERLLERAERDVDRAIGGPPHPLRARRLDPAELTAPQAAALARACCAAAEFRVRQRETTLIGARDGIATAGSLTFSRDPTPRVSPKMLEELAGLGLIARSATVQP